MKAPFAVAGGRLAFAALATLYLVWGSTFVAIKVGLEGLPPFTLATGGALGLVSVALGEPRLVEWAALPASTVLAVVYLALIGSCLDFSAFSWLSRNVSPTLLSTFSYVNPIVAVLLGSVFLGESLDGHVLAGGSLIVSAIVLVIRG